jgi:hypothetical protein
MVYFTLTTFGFSVLLFSSSILAHPAPEAVPVSIALSLDLGRPGFGLGPGAKSAPPPLPLASIAASNTGLAALPTPTGPPKYVQLGLGYQNYTCNGTSFVQTAPSSGAIANLYDITNDLSPSNIDTISPAALKKFEACLTATSCVPAQGQDCDLCHTIAMAASEPDALRQTGLHLFDRPAAAQVPNFDIYDSNDFISVKRAGGVAAPAGSYTGSNGLGTVAWLYLVDNASGRSHGLSSVYRVETAGGVAPSTCTAAGTQVFIPYAAQYWFYQ